VGDIGAYLSMMMPIYIHAYPSSLIDHSSMHIYPHCMMIHLILSHSMMNDSIPCSFLVD